MDLFLLMHNNIGDLSGILHSFSLGLINTTSCVVWAEGKRWGVAMKWNTGPSENETVDTTNVNPCPVYY